ncbi:hypothetical protein EYF80_042015 [Liparis tanakae]|uniref:Uncharacterized protein n=1 Tax=Liparis tanakae TaxID=230148 RepID=A0A4Z2G599_9TELE|nr:hypothetical protein EYF80_042015 [Liparis tanakae]
MCKEKDRGGGRGGVNTTDYCPAAIFVCADRSQQDTALWNSHAGRKKRKKRRRRRRKRSGGGAPPDCLRKRRKRSQMFYSELDEGTKDEVPSKSG